VIVCLDPVLRYTLSRHGYTAFQGCLTDPVPDMSSLLQSLPFPKAAFNSEVKMSGSTLSTRSIVEVVVVGLGIFVAWRAWSAYQDGLKERIFQGEGRKIE